MKRILLALVLVAGVCGVVFAEQPASPTAPMSQEKLQLIERNLVIGLESGIPSLQASAALVLRQVREIAPEYDFGLCIIPLMRIVRTSDYNVETRLAAGLALFELKTDRGDFAISRIAKFEDNQRVKKLFVAMAYERGLQHNLY